MFKMAFRLHFYVTLTWLLSGKCFGKEGESCSVWCDCRYSSLEVAVRCRGKNLTRIPDGIPSNTTTLDLSDNILPSIHPEALSNLTYLKYLYLENNRLERLKKGIFDNLKHLKLLNIKNNVLKEFPQVSLPSLSYLYLENNSLTQVPAAIKTFTKLRHLNLDSNRISSIPKDIFRHLTDLQDLKMSCNQIVKIEYGAFPESLVNLTLEYNNITSLPSDLCTKLSKLSKVNQNMNRVIHLSGDISNCSSLEYLKLDHNNITLIGSSLQGMKNLKEISLKGNSINYIWRDAFKGITRLTNLILSQNNIKDIEEETFIPLKSLTMLNLRRNSFTSVPTKALRSLGQLKHLILDGNPIKCIHDLAFEGLHKLSQFWTWDKVEKVQHSAFAQLPGLIKLTLVSVKLKRFPNLTGTNSLQELTLESNAITSLPENICEMFPKLYNLNANMNRITRLPDMSKCSSMILLHLVNNKIQSIGTSLQGMENLEDVTLKDNEITQIPSNVFKGNKRLKKLNLANNNIKYIDEDAFASLESLREVDLSDNEFTKLPSKGMTNVIILKLRGNKHLNEISAESLPNVRLVEASYPYHCCQFRKKMKELAVPQVEKKSSVQSSWTWKNVNYLSVDSPGNASIDDGEDDLSGFGSASIDPVLTENGEGSGGDSPTLSTDMPIGSGGELSNAATRHQEVNCTPLPDPFFPCVDLMGSWLLRVGVWLVFLLALLGNAVVVIVIMLSNSKVDVSKFLIMNLAVADLCMGVYLGLLAVIDASTIGDFMHHGVDWQQSLGCKSAGFLAVLSSEASVFTLAVITIERYIAIRHALHVERKMSLRKTAVVMASGWVVALIIATLPLVKISDYTKFSVCLPFETGDVQSLSFVTLLLGLNLVAFLVIFGCYVRIYFEIRGSNAWNTNDTQVALRMALLVVTDFLCWAPIVIIALPAAFGSTFVSLEQAKVFTVFVFPLNSCANPFLYAIFTYQFKKDCMNICRRVHNSPVPPIIQITLTKKRLSMSGIPVGLRHSSNCSAVYTPETHSDGKITLRVPGVKVTRRHSLPAAFKLTALQRASIRNSAASSDNENSRSSNENTTEQTTLAAQDKPRLGDRQTTV